MNETIIQIITGISINIITAGVLYILFERYQKKKEKHELKLEKERELIYHKRKNINLIRAMLLDQYPPLIEKVQNVQKEAYAISLYGYNENNINITPMHIASELRYYANVHMDVKDTLACMGIKSREIVEFALLTNTLAVLALQLARNEKVLDGIYSVINSHLKEIRLFYNDEFLGSSHLENIENGLLNIKAESIAFSTYDEQNKIKTLAKLSENIGRISALYGEYILKRFRTEVYNIKSEIEMK